ncbi:filaggrin-like [Herpailurus yagouaroundi]|uniref:filaggrin-like n=1 Tax=Herpailurus yagouaroundi TaxID=1608482 RepID=UPI001AD7DABB|nr:filaggrin-like [Puma yagouaroundi]
MSTLLENIIAIIDLFHEYSTTDKETDTLSRKELKELLEREFRPVLKNPDDPDTADVFMHILDLDHDKKIDFTEYFLMVFKLATAYYESNRRQNFQAKEQNQNHHTHRTKDEDDDLDEDKVQEEKEEKLRKSTQSGKTHEKRKETRSKGLKGKGEYRHKQRPDNSRQAGSLEGEEADGGHLERGSRHHQSSTQAHGSRHSHPEHGQSSSESRPVRNRGSSVSQDSDSEGHSEDSDRHMGLPSIVGLHTVLGAEQGQSSAELLFACRGECLDFV